MANKKAWLAYLPLVVFLLTGCDLFRAFSEGRAQPKLSRIEMVDLVQPVPLRSPLSGEPAQRSKSNQLKRTAKCADFSSMAVSNEITDPWPIFVDAQVAKSGSGSSWTDAVKSVGEGLRKAQWQRQQWAAGINKDRPILVVIAGGNYSFDHERAEKLASGGGAMPDGASLLAFTGVQFSTGIEILGGYFPGDPCLEIAINLQENPGSATSRETILDGQFKSYHVVLLMSDDPDHTKKIVLKDLTVTGGHASGVDTADAVLNNLKKMGGAIAIRGHANDIKLDRVKLTNSVADKNGGCLAISQQAHNIKLNDPVFNLCTAMEDGGAISIADGARDIVISEARASQCRAGLNGGALAISSADVVANTGLAIGSTAAQIRDASVKNIEINNSDFNNNEASFAGGGVSIINTKLDPAAVLLSNVEPNFVPRIKFTNTKINNNKTTDPASPGGAGIALLNNVEKIEITGGEISNNESAAGQGAGGLISNTVQEVKLSGLSINANQFAAGAMNNGGGLAVMKIKALSISGGEISGHTNSNLGAGLFVRKAEGVFLGANLNIRHNQAYSGAGAYFDQVKNLSIDDITCAANFASKSGGGLYLAKNHLLAHRRVNYADNSAIEDGGGIYVYGSYDNALALEQKMPMNDINCLSNHAANLGGCAHIQNAPDTEIIGGRYYQNGKPGQAGNPPVNIARSEYGGAVFYEASGLLDTLKVVGTANPDDRFHANEAESGGGALFVNNLLELKLEGAKFSNNRVFWGNGGAVGGSFKDNSKVVVSLGAKFTNNTAESDGGALYLGENLELLHIAAAEFDGNSSVNGNGGAVYAGFLLNAPNNTYKLWLQSQAVFTLNKAISVGSKGGGVYISRAPYRVELAATFNRNEANNGGGGISFSGNQNINALLTYGGQTSFENNISYNNHGGGMLVDNTVDITAASDLSGTYNNNQAPLGQGAGVAYLGALPAGVVFKTNGASFDGNVATQNPAIYLVNIPLAGLEFVNTNFLNHHPTNSTCGGVMTIPNPIDELKFNGGWAYNNSSKAIVPNLILRHGYGGAFCAVQVNNTVNVSNYTAFNNMANHGGGGFLYVLDNAATPSVAIDNSTFTSNKALGGDGGSLRIQNVNHFIATNTAFVSNIARDNGGAIAVSSASGDVGISNFLNSVSKLYFAVLSRTFDWPVNPAYENLPKVMGNTARTGGAFYFNTINQEISINDQVWLGNRATHGAGGAFYTASANFIGGTSTEILSSLIAENSAQTQGGAIYIGQLNGKNLKISQNDDFNARRPDQPMDAAHLFDNPAHYISQRNLRIADGDFLKVGKAIMENNLNNFNGIDQAGTKRGMFLIEGNTAGTNGGAIYVNNPGDVNITNMSFANNTATAGSGGTLFVDNLANTFEFNKTIIYGGKAKDNAGGIYVRGNNIGLSPRIVDIKNNSSIQNCQVTNGLAAGGSAGVYLERVNRLELKTTNFFANQVLLSAGGKWAGAIKFNDRADALPLVNGFYNSANPLTDGNHPLVNSADGIPVYVNGPIELRDNQVSNSAGNIGTISIPAALKTINYYLYTDNPFVISGNSPPPFNGDAQNVVITH